MTSTQTSSELIVDSRPDKYWGINPSKMKHQTIGTPKVLRTRPVGVVEQAGGFTNTLGDDNCDDVELARTKRDFFGFLSPAFLEEER